MTDEATGVSDDTVAMLARLHRESLPSSVLAALGAAALQRYYRWVATSDTERLFVAGDGARTTAAAVLSLAPHSVLRRFITAAPLGFARDAVRAWLTDPGFRTQARLYLREPGDATPEVPEVLQIFVAANARSRHVGSALLDRVEARLASRGLNRYCVRTLAHDNVATLAFYQKRGFVPARELTFCGARYLVLEKGLQ